MQKPQTDSSTLPQRAPTMEEQHKKDAIHGNIEKVLAKKYKARKLIKFFKELGLFGNIQENHEENEFEG